MCNVHQQFFQHVCRDKIKWIILQQHHYKIKPLNIYCFVTTAEEIPYKMLFLFVFRLLHSFREVEKVGKTSVTNHYICKSSSWLMHFLSSLVGCTRAHFGKSSLDGGGGGGGGGGRHFVIGFPVRLANTRPQLEHRVQGVRQNVLQKSALEIKARLRSVHLQEMTFQSTMQSIATPCGTPVKTRALVTL
jgi:hypothetical protein